MARKLNVERELSYAARDERGVEMLVENGQIVMEMDSDGLRRDVRRRIRTDLMLKMSEAEVDEIMIHVTWRVKG